MKSDTGDAGRGGQCAKVISHGGVVMGKYLDPDDGNVLVVDMSNNDSLGVRFLEVILLHLVNPTALRLV